MLEFEYTEHQDIILRTSWGKEAIPCLSNALISSTFSMSGSHCLSADTKPLVNTATTAKEIVARPGITQGSRTGAETLAAGHRGR